MRRLKFSRVVLAISMLCFLHGADPSAAKAAPADSQKKDGSTVIAYYFHGDYRCYNCMTIEQYSKEAIEKYFPEQLKKESLRSTSLTSTFLKTHTLLKTTSSTPGR